MGIPSYYKKLCDRIPGLLSKERKGLVPTHLWIDFNCMVYHCLRRPGAKQYEGETTRLEWENNLIQDVCKYLKKIVQQVGPTEQVFVGIDGVVPMAKMRQQRLRRFKSQWVTAEEVRIGKSQGGPRWDTNAITPGTEFMERLGKALKDNKAQGLKWIVSTAEEPGEGEHKIMKQLRNCLSKKSHVVYGLDADLIVLSLLQNVDKMWLYREAVECGEVQYNLFNEEEYRYFCIHKLKEYLCYKKDESFLLDYCMAMSLLGNDFLPHGLSLKIKDGGHDLLLKMLEQVRKQSGPLILHTKGVYTWNKATLLGCISWLAENEEAFVKKHCSMKVSQKDSLARGTTPVEIATDEWNKIPLRHCEELALVKSYKQNDQRHLEIELKDNWTNIYYERWFRTQEKQPIVKEYLLGLQWILNYYVGNTIDQEWCFPWFLPPLWGDMAEYLQQNDMPVFSVIEENSVKPQEQLAMVLPVSSWWLLRDASLRKLPRLAPQFWPTTFELFTAGRKMTWECEAQIPLLLPKRVRYYLNEAK
jgi:5'-3' exonuclease